MTRETMIDAYRKMTGTMDGTTPSEIALNSFIKESSPPPSPSETVMNTYLRTTASPQEQTMNIEWIEQENGNASWQFEKRSGDKIHSTVFLTTDTDTDWYWVINCEGKAHYSRRFTNMDDAKDDVRMILVKLSSMNLSWDEVHDH